MIKFKGKKGDNIKEKKGTNSSGKKANEEEKDISFQFVNTLKETEEAQKLVRSIIEYIREKIIFDMSSVEESLLEDILLNLLCLYKLRVPPYLEMRDPNESLQTLLDKLVKTVLFFYSDIIYINAVQVKDLIDLLGNSLQEISQKIKKQNLNIDKNINNSDDEGSHEIN